MIETSTLVLTYTLTVPVFFAIDLLWLGVIARKFYQNQIGHLLAEKTNWPIAIGFYLFYIVGILYFAVIPAAILGSLEKVIITATLFGAFTYGTYELTNLATLKDWPKLMALVDILWGMALTVVTAVTAFYIFLWLS